MFDFLIATDASIDRGGDDEDEESAEEEEQEGEQKKKSSRTSSTKTQSAEADYGVSRGIDFQGVNFVVNFDFPASAAAYTHRVGRTGRGGATGTALSFVAAVPTAASSTTEAAAPASEVEAAFRDQELLQVVREEQPRLNASGTSGNVLAAIGAGSDELGGEDASAEEERRMQPAPLQFNFRELESFRYRVEDTLRSVTTTAVKELRSAELKREILNSERLKSFFAENPNDLKVLRHDKAIAHPIRQKDHLKSVPEYLMPVSMRGVSNVRMKNKRGKKRKTVTAGSQEQRVLQSKKRNPLYNPDNGAEDAGEGADTGASAGDGEAGDAYDAQTGGDSMDGGISGRKEWKMRHKKGAFNPKTAKKNENRTPGTFVQRKRK